MTKLFLYLGVFLFCAFDSAAQTTFLSTTYNTANDDLLHDYVRLSANRNLFVGAQLKPNPSYKWADGLIIMTDAEGNFVRQKTFPHSADSVNLTILKVFANGNTLEVLGVEGFAPVESYLVAPVNQAIVWMKLDTALNVLEQKKYQVASGRQIISRLRVVRHNRRTYAAISTGQDFQSSSLNVQSALIKFDSSMNLISTAPLTSQTYNTALNVNGSYLFDISLDTVTQHLFVTGFVRISTATDSSFQPSTVLLHKFDTALSLIDTFQVRRFTTTGTGNDTFIFKPVETLPLTGHRIVVGPVLTTTTILPATSTDRVGVSIYNTALRRHALKATVPTVNSTDKQLGDVHTKAMSLDNRGHVYAIASSHLLAGASLSVLFAQNDNKMVVAKYDTTGNLLWHRFLGSPGGYYTGSLIKCDDDNTVTILAARYDYVNSPNNQQRDFYVLRLDSSGTVTAVFPVTRSAASPVVYPNPATSALNIRLPKSGGEATVFLYSSSGAAVRQVGFTGAETSIHIADLPPGVYGYRVVSGNDGASGSGQFLKR